MLRGHDRLSSSAYFVSTVASLAFGILRPPFWKRSSLHCFRSIPSPHPQHLFHGVFVGRLTSKNEGGPPILMLMDRRTWILSLVKKSLPNFSPKPVRVLLVQISIGAMTARCRKSIRIDLFFLVSNTPFILAEWLSTYHVIFRHILRTCVTTLFML